MKMLKSMAFTLTLLTLSSLEMSHGFAAPSSAPAPTIAPSKNPFDTSRPLSAEEINKNLDNLKGIVQEEIGKAVATGNLGIDRGLIEEDLVKALLQNGVDGQKAQEIAAKRATELIQDSKGMTPELLNVWALTAIDQNKVVFEINVSHLQKSKAISDFFMAQPFKSEVSNFRLLVRTETKDGLANLAGLPNQAVPVSANITIPELGNKPFPVRMYVNNTERILPSLMKHVYGTEYVISIGINEWNEPSQDFLSSTIVHELRHFYDALTDPEITKYENRKKDKERIEIEWGNRKSQLEEIMQQIRQDQAYRNWLSVSVDDFKRRGDVRPAEKLAEAFEKAYADNFLYESDYWFKYLNNEFEKKGWREQIRFLVTLGYDLNQILELFSRQKTRNPNRKQLPAVLGSELHPVFKEIISQRYKEVTSK